MNSPKDPATRHRFVLIAPYNASAARIGGLLDRLGVSWRMWGATTWFLSDTTHLESLQWWKEKLFPVMEGLPFFLQNCSADSPSVGSLAPQMTSWMKEHWQSSDEGASADEVTLSSEVATEEGP